MNVRPVLAADTIAADGPILTRSAVITDVLVVMVLGDGTCRGAGAGRLGLVAIIPPRAPL